MKEPVGGRRLENDVAEKTARLVGLMDKHLGTRGKSFEQSLRRAGRQLPRGLRAKGRMLIEAETYAAHPKLMRQVDMAAVDSAVRDFETFLSGIDRAEARKTRALNMAARLAFQFLVIAVALLVFLRWRGLV